MSYRAATRVPLAMRWGGTFPPGTEDRRFALNIDLTATIGLHPG